MDDTLQKKPDQNCHDVELISKKLALHGGLLRGWVALDLWRSEVPL